MKVAVHLGMGSVVDQDLRQLRRSVIENFRIVPVVESHRGFLGPERCVFPGRLCHVAPDADMAGDH